MTEENRFEYESGSWPYNSVKWRIYYKDYILRGEAVNVKQAYRKAKRALKRYKKMEKRLEG